MIDLRDQLGAVRDQGSRPTCTSFAVTALHEASKCQEGRPELSEEHLHFQAAGGAGGAVIPVRVGDAGATLASAGQVPLPQWAYDGSRVSYQPSDPPPSVIAGDAHRSGLAEIRAIFADVATSIERGTCVLLVIEVMSTFDRPDEDGVVHEAPFGEKRRGLHAVVAVGVDGEGEHKRLLVRNSWDSDWCLDGHAYLTQAFVGAHVLEAWVISAAEKVAA